ncbi:hypothetical protein HanRHA438_Chr00c11g0848551 [Helianthus annuus]|nr:hypothetical protein HanRHA438_Chr00c11g0848551 [Helianthus annuus]
MFAVSDSTLHKPSDSRLMFLFNNFVLVEILFVSPQTNILYLAGVYLYQSTT